MRGTPVARLYRILKNKQKNNEYKRVGVWLHLVCVRNYRWYGRTCSGEDELHEVARQEMGVGCREERKAERSRTLVKGAVLCDKVSKRRAG